LEWRQPGTVWAADFKERREPIEGRYRWILSVKDLASHCQLVWQPVVDATAQIVQATYARLFLEHGPPLIMKSDNGGPFRADETQQFLAEQGVIPLYNPVRHPQYNGGIERANGQLASYQETLAELRGRPGMPTSDDAESARHLANQLTYPAGFRGPTAGQLWEQRAPITADQRAAFQKTVTQHRAQLRAQWNFLPAEALTYHQAAAIDRRAVRDTLLEHDLLRIHPRCASRDVHLTESAHDAMQQEQSAGRMELATVIAASIVGAAADYESRVATPIHNPFEEAHCSTNKLSASGKN
jgi:hypothetical protein